MGLRSFLRRNTRERKYFQPHQINRTGNSCNELVHINDADKRFLLFGKKPLIEIETVSLNGANRYLWRKILNQAKLLTSGRI